MKRLMLAAMIATIAGQAQALSCAPPDIARTFNWAAAAEESYIVLNGSFSFEPLPRTRASQLAPETMSRDAVFEGSYLGVEGFKAAPSLDVTLTFVCLGPWCGSMGNDGDDILVFAQQSANGYVLEIDPCYSTIFAPSDDNIDRVEACMRGESCEAVPF
ncbi:hypothetical protein SAMN05444287_2440 [Octadecabacter temperatus]|uniref:Uncharacterized protein n=1 Tax=Octadecabacter temperatus TaxID=1458307 RepID=A0A0K0Y167_9RHOB|nr:hypothetical protein [Octadecabacter temperatus]AKS44647.1 hypothetical protein OSB_00780 [Octadecabacter temperatus]SIO37028.1 hypothetical protein SAMN05444287_2440 [Octadecabacter temperatus]